MAAGGRPFESHPLDLLLVEDDAGLAEAIAAGLRGFGHAVTVAGDGQAARRAMDRNAHDAIVLEWMLPGADALALLRQLREQAMTLPVIVVGAGARPVDTVEALRLGADDYMVRPVAAEELDARLEAVLRARRWTGGGDTIRAGDIVVSPGRLRAWRGGVALDLGATEFGLLRELVRDAGLVVTRAMLLERVWGADFVPATNILDTYICRLRARLALPDRPDPIVTRRGIGYMLRG